MLSERIGLVTQRYPVSLTPELESLLRQSNSTSESILSKEDYQQDAQNLKNGERLCVGKAHGCMYTLPTR